MQFGRIKVSHELSRCAQNLLHRIQNTAWLHQLSHIWPFICYIREAVTSVAKSLLLTAHMHWFIRRISTKLMWILCSSLSSPNVLTILDFKFSCGASFTFCVVHLSAAIIVHIRRSRQQPFNVLVDFSSQMANTLHTSQTLQRVQQYEQEIGTKKFVRFTAVNADGTVGHWHE